MTSHAGGHRRRDELPGRVPERRRPAGRRGTGSAGPKATLQEITRIAVVAAPDAEGAFLTTFVDGTPGVVAADSSWARELDELQYEEREGPCLDAARTGNAFRVRDMAAEGRWPFYVPRAVEHGARSMVSLPVAAEGKIIGALNLYARQPEVFPSEQVSLAEIITAQVGMATQVAASFFRHRDLAEQMRQAMQSRAVIEQAQGHLDARPALWGAAGFRRACPAVPDDEPQAA